MTVVIAKALFSIVVLAGILPAGVDIQPYPGAEVFAMGDSARVNDREFGIYYFTTKATPHQVAEYYRKMWEEEGHIVFYSRSGDEGAAVGYVDLRTMASRSVSLWRRGALTYGFPAVVQGIAVPSSSDSNGEVGGVPIHPGGEGISSYESLEKGAMFRTVSYSDSASLQKNESFYLREMGQRGWRLSKRHTAEDAKGAVMLDFDQGTLKMSVTLAWISEHQRCSVFAVTNVVTASHREERP
jgi:hypothetical protein